MKKFLIGLALTIIGFALLFLIPSPQPSAPMPWEIEQMSNGQIKVFDIHLGTSNYNHAQQSLKQYGETSIFKQQGTNSTVEAFFNSVNLGGLSGKMVLNLSVDEHQIEAMVSRATEARLQPSGAHRYQLSNQDNAALIDATISAITYIPSVKLNPEMIIHRFGNAENIEQDNTTEIWQYPTRGLTIYLNEGEKTIMQYQEIP